MAFKKPNKTNAAMSGLTGAGNVSSWSASQNQTAAQLMGIYTGAGMSKAGAAGLIGNQMQESSLSDTAPGGGLSQWIGSRYAALKTFAASISQPVNSVTAQGNFAVHELKTQYPQLWSMLTTTNDPQAAALAISQQYERPAAAAANNPNRQAQAQLAFDGVSGAPQAPASTSGNGGNSGGNSGGYSPLDALMSFVSGDFQTLAGQLAGLAVTMVKDTAIGIGDLVIVPFWHWNQRAAQQYWIMMTDPTQAVWMLPGTAVFWGFGYWLLWTDPDAKGLTPQPVPRARLARHVRDAQSLPARRGLVKPKDVLKRTIKKPKPTVSRAVIMQTGTMQATRHERVTVSGQHGSISRQPIDRTGEVRETAQQREGQAGQAREAQAPPPTTTKPHEEHRTGSVSLPDRRGGTQGSSGTGRKAGSRA